MKKRTEITTLWTIATEVLIIAAMTLPFPYMDIYRMRTGAESFIKYISLTEMFTMITPYAIMAACILLGMLMSKTKVPYYTYALLCVFALIMAAGVLKTMWRSTMMFAGGIVLLAYFAVLFGRLFRKIETRILTQGLLHLFLTLTILSRILFHSYTI